MELALSTVQRHEQRQRSPMETLTYVWEQSKRHFIQIGQDSVEFVVCDPRYLHLLDEDEHYGVYVGRMIFVSTRTPERWFPFVVLHEWLERGHADAGIEDEEQHFSALFDELRVAGNIFDFEEFRAYLYWRRSVERSRYFEERDPEVQEFFKGEHSAGLQPPDLRPWTRRTLSFGSLAGLLGYDAAHELGATHAQLMVLGLRDSSIPLGDIHAVVAAVAHVDAHTAVQLPRELSEAVHAIADGAERPVLLVVQEDPLTVRWKDGRSGATLRAMARLLCVGQERLLQNGVRVPLPQRTAAARTRYFPLPLFERSKPACPPRAAMPFHTQQVIQREYGSYLVHILRSCRTEHQMKRFLLTLDTRAQAKFRGWLVQKEVAVPAHARDVGLLPLGTIAVLLNDAEYPDERIPQEIKPLEYWRDPRPLDEVLEANIPLLLALMEYRHINPDDLPSWIEDHCDYAPDSVAWLVHFLRQELEDDKDDEDDEDEGKCIVSASGHVDHRLFKEILREEYELDIDELSALVEHCVETPAPFADIPPAAQPPEALHPQPPEDPDARVESPAESAAVQPGGEQQVSTPEPQMNYASIAANLADIQKRMDSLCTVAAMRA